MKYGIFTPVHKINVKDFTFLANSIFNQTVFKDADNRSYLWVILLNGNANTEEGKDAITKIIEKSPENLKVIIATSETDGIIGALKGEACEILIKLGADYLLEVDYDDALHETCLSHVVSNYEGNKDLHFVYTDFAHFGWRNGIFESITYGTEYGWKHLAHNNSKLFGNETLIHTVCFEPKACYLYRIECAPNHLRSFSTRAYIQVGGYNHNLSVGDDHDLVCRIFKEYGEKGFKHIPLCLYYQRYDSSTTTHLKIDQIQKQVDINYINHSEEMFLKQAKDDGLLALDLGGRFNCPEGYKSVDLQDADIILDLNKSWTGQELARAYVPNEIIRFRGLIENSVGVLRAYHVLEHLDDPIHFFNEAYRVLAPGGVLLIEVPSARDYHAFADPTHKSFWTELNFEYYCKENKARFIRPQYKGAFQIMRLVEYAWPDGTLCISAQLIALKGFYNDRHWGVKETDAKFIQ